MTPVPIRTKKTRTEFVRGGYRWAQSEPGLVSRSWTWCPWFSRFFVVSAFLAATFATESLAAPPSRGSKSSPPTSSGKVLQFQGASYVDVPTWAARYGLKSTWIDQGRRLQLSSDYTQMILEADRRELMINEMRIFLGEPLVAHGGALWIGSIDAQNLLGAILRPAGIAGKVPALRVICLDPGHGGNDTGTQNKALKLDEKRLTLDVALRTKKILEGKGYRVVMTRTDDRYVELEDRAAIANRYKADLFVSIHFNAFPQPGVRGTETFILTRRTQRSTGASKRERSDNVGLPGHAFDPWNAVLGYAMHRQLINKLGSFDRGLKFARFKVLTLLNCPGLLVESGYLSNEAEGRKIASASYRADLATAISNGIEVYSAQLQRARE